MLDVLGRYMLPNLQYLVITVESLVVLSRPILTLYHGRQIGCRMGLAFPFWFFFVVFVIIADTAVTPTGIYVLAYIHATRYATSIRTRPSNLGTGTITGTSLIGIGTRISGHK